MAQHRSEWGQNDLWQDTGFNYRFGGHIGKLYCRFWGGYPFQIKKSSFSWYTKSYYHELMVNLNQYFLDI